MASQIDKYNEKYNKRIIKKTNLNKEKSPMSPETKSNDWAEQFRHNEYYQLAEKLGYNPSTFSVSNNEDYKNAIASLEELFKNLSEEELKAQPSELQEKISKLKEKDNQESQQPEAIVEDQAQPEETPVAEVPEEQTQPEETLAAEVPEEQVQPTLEVGSIADEQPLENDWIEEKRKFWQEYAQSVENQFENDPQKDQENKTFSCVLSNDQDRGEVSYSSPNNVQINKESHLTMYQGLVADAVKNNMSITFGQTLDDKQKAMLLAACLMNNQTYANGESLAMVNPPKIDMNADYFKELPEDVRQTLQTYNNNLHMKEKQAEIDKRREDIRNRIKKSHESGVPLQREDILKSAKDAYHKDELLSEVLTEKETDREKIMAARLGITGAYTSQFKDAEGKERKFEKENDLDKSGRISPEVQAQLMQKYGKKDGK